MSRFIVDRGSCNDVLLLDTFEGLNMDLKFLQPYRGSLVYFLEERLQIRGYVSILTMFKVGRSDEVVEVKIIFLLYLKA